MKKRAKSQLNFFLLPGKWLSAGKAVAVFALAAVLSACTSYQLPPPPVMPAPGESEQKPPAEPHRFVDVAAEVGLTFRHGAFRQEISMDPVAAMGGGLCWLDFDNDGWLDLYAVNSHALAEAEFWQGRGGLPTNALFHNRRGRFVDVSASSGTGLALRGNGCLAADLNGDGFTDLYITADGPNALLWNNGDGTFREGAAAAGVAAPEWSSAAVAGDLNGDGRLDLFVAAYIDLEKKIEKPSGAFPQDFLGLPDRLYLNSGNDRAGRAVFREVTAEAGLLREERGLGALLSDLDGDGDLDLYIANDGHPNRLYANQPAPADPLGFRFVDLTDSAQAGDSGSGMGVAGGDYDGDDWTDLVITNWQNELNAVYRNDFAGAGGLQFEYSTFRIGVAGLGNGVTGWGVHLADFDQDTDTDLLIVNGRVPITDLRGDRQLARYLRNRSVETTFTPRAGQFLDWTGPIGLEAVGPLLGRGSAAGDFDNDGDLDVAVAQIGGPLALLRNEQPPGHWLQIALEPPVPGAQALLTLPDGRVLRRELYAGSSYLATEAPRLHFGLGAVAEVPEVVVRLPDGRSFGLADVAADQIVLLPVR